MSAQARQAAEAAEQATLRAGQAKRGKAGWLAAGAAVASLCVGVGLWWAIDGGKSDIAEQHAGTPDAGLQARQASELSGQVEPSRQAEPAAHAAQAGPAEADVPAAAILDQVHAAPVAAASKGPSLKEMLNTPSAPPPKSPEEELTKLLASAPPDASPAASQARGTGAAAKAGEKKAAPPARAGAKEGAPKQLAKADAKVGAKPDAKADAKSDDASLLAALVAHAKEREGAQRNASNASAPTSLKQCKQLNAAQAEQCRVRLCAGSARNEAECKARLPVKAAD